MKVQKNPLKTRPIVSYSGSRLHPMGVWTDVKLQVAARQVCTYFKSSFDLKKELTSTVFPANTRIFTADAVSMYTNIPTGKALKTIRNYLNINHPNDLPVEAVMEALSIIMENNVFSFGDCYFRQRNGTAMGAPPAPPWATLYLAENETMLIEKYKKYLILLRRFIDDLIGLWLWDDSRECREKWNEFQQDLNNPHLELEWVTSEMETQVDFMDLTIKITNGRIDTTLYEKPNNLHLYIPPNSCHPPGLLTGMIHGIVHRVHTLCTSDEDKTTRLQSFYKHLRARDYNKKSLLPHFNKAIKKVKTYAGPIEKDKNALDGAVFFHIPYHPNDMPLREIQYLWHRYVVNPDPPHTRPLWDMKNWKGKKCGLRRLIVAYHRPPNLGNILSSRKIRDTDGPNVSTFMV